MSKIIKETRCQIILTANDPWIPKLRALRQQVALFEFIPFAASEIINIIVGGCKKENVEFEEGALRNLAMSVNRDVRAAITDSQVLASDKKITLSELKLWGREREEKLGNILRLIFKSYDSETLWQAADSIGVDMREPVLWLDQNIPSEYLELQDKRNAANILTHADIFLGRIHKQQHWRFLLYAKILALVGVQQAKSRPNPNIIKHRRSELLQQIFIRAAKQHKYRAWSEQLAGEVLTFGA